VVRNFDIDIVQIFATADPDHFLFPQVAFENRKAMESYTKYRFKYTVRPCAEPALVKKRIDKYLKRGFYLGEIEFDSRLTFVYKDYVLNSVRSILTKDICHLMLRTELEDAAQKNKEEDGKPEATHLESVTEDFDEGVYKYIQEYICKGVSSPEEKAKLLNDQAFVELKRKTAKRLRM